MGCFALLARIAPSTFADGFGTSPTPAAVSCAVSLFHTVLHLDETVRLVSVIRQFENDRLVHFFCKLLMRLTNTVSDLAFSSRKPENGVYS